MAPSFVFNDANIAKIFKIQTLRLKNQISIMQLPRFGAAADVIPGTFVSGMIVIA